MNNLKIEKLTMNQPTPEQIAAGLVYIQAQVANLPDFVADQIPADKIPAFVAAFASAILNPSTTGE
jgi:hypothetical protein